MRERLIVVFSLPILLAGCAGEPSATAVQSTPQAPHRESVCAGFDGNEQDPCNISMYALVAQPTSLNGLYVEITGVYVEGLDPVLFADRDSAENSVLKNGVFISAATPDIASKLDKHRNKFVTLSGTFSSVVRNRSEFGPRDFAQFSGVIKVNRVGSATSAPIPYACWDPDRDREYDPRTVKALLGEVVCNDAAPQGSAEKPMK